MRSVKYAPTCPDKQLAVLHTAGIHRRVGADQFRASLQRHLDALIEEEEDYPSANTMHQYAASLLREIKAWIETGS